MSPEYVRPYITAQKNDDRDAEGIDHIYANAVLDRLVRNAHRIELSGESLRRACGKGTKNGLTKYIRK